MMHCMQGLCKNIIYIIILLQFVACHFRLADSLYPSCWCRIARLMAVQVPFVGRDFFYQLGAPGDALAARHKRHSLLAVYLILAHNYDMCSIAHGCPWDL